MQAARAALSKSRSLPRGRAPVAALVVTATSAWLLAPGASITADSQYALIWGNELLHGKAPEYGTVWAPAPHPLGTAVGAAASIFGERGSAAFMLAVTFLGLAASLLLVFQIARTLFDLPVAVAALALFATSATIWAFTVAASVDVLSCALVLAAVALELRRPRAGAPALVLLGLAGLQRPEVWALAGVYWLYLLPGLTLRKATLLAAVAVLPVAVWLAVNLASTSEGTFALQAAQEGGRGFDFSFAQVVARPFLGLRDNLRLPGLAISLAGAVVALWLRPARARLPAVVAALVLGALVGLGFLRLLVLARFTMVPGAMLCVFFGFAAMGWRSLRSGWGRILWAAGGTGLALVTVAVAGALQVGEIGDVAAKLRQRDGVLDDARALERQAPADRMLRHCRPVLVAKPLAPFVAWQLDRPLRDFEIVRVAGKPPMYGTPVPKRGLILDLRGAVARRRYQEGGHAAVPAGFRRVASNRAWTLYARGC